MLFRTTYIGILAFGLAACAHLNINALKQFRNLEFSETLLRARLKQQARKPYEAANLYSFSGVENLFLKVIEDSDLDETSALERISSRRETLKQQLIRQRDPYNIEPGELLCDLKQFDQSTLELTDHSLFSRLDLKASNFYLTECFNNQSAVFQERVEFLYCKQSRKLFELHLFTSLKSTELDELQLANCK